MANSLSTFTPRHVTNNSVVDGSFPEVFYSTGVLTVVATDDTPDSYGIPEEGLVLADLQGCEVTYAWEDRALHGAMWIGGWPTAVAFINGSAHIKASFARFNGAAVRLLAAGAAATVGGDPVSRLGGPVAMPPFKVVFVGQNIDGNQARLTFGKVYAPKLTIPFKREDFSMPDVEFVAVPDDGGTISTEEFTEGAFA
jgi:hypothetical protein